MGIILFIIACVLILTGFVVNVLTFIGTPVMFAAVVVLSYLNQFNDVSILMFIVLLLLTLIAEILDFFSGVFGVKLSGASKTTQIYSVVGMTIGTIVALITLQFYLMFVGLFTGVILAEIKQSGSINAPRILKVSLSILLSKLVAYLIKICTSVVLFVTFIIQAIKYFG